MMLRRITWLGISFIVIIMVAGIFYLALNLFVAPFLKPGLPVFNLGLADVNKINATSTIRQENSYLCKDVELVYQGPPSGEIIGLTREGINKKFPAENGWAVEFRGDGLVEFKHVLDDFCSRHKSYRHLGLYRNVLAVYQGPLGCDDKLLRLEERKRIEKLPPDLRESLETAVNYRDLNEDQRDELRNRLEFIDEIALNNALENLDEYSD